MTILPSVYWGSIEWYAHIMQRECVLDLGRTMSNARSATARA